MIWLLIYLNVHCSCPIEFGHSVCIRVNVARCAFVCLCKRANVNMCKASVSVSRYLPSYVAIMNELLLLTAMICRSYHCALYILIFCCDSARTYGMEHDFVGFSSRSDTFGAMADVMDDVISDGKDRCIDRKRKDNGDRLEPADKRVRMDGGSDEPQYGGFVAPHVNAEALLEKHGQMMQMMQA